MAHCPYTMGRMECYWGTNAHRFDPSRHLNKPRPSPYILTAFHAGPRICLGQQLAYTEAKYVLVKLVLNFYIEVVDQSEVVPVQDLLTLAMKDGVKVKLTPRRDHDGQHLAQ